MTLRSRSRELYAARRLMPHTGLGHSPRSGFGKHTYVYIIHNNKYMMWLEVNTRTHTRTAHARTRRSRRTDTRIYTRVVHTHTRTCTK